MKEKFDTYIEIIGIKGELIDRIKTICEQYKEISTEEITDIFVTDYINKDGSREYENLWLFSDDCCMEANNFITEDSFDCSTLKNRITRWEVNKQNYDFRDTSEKSRLNINFNMENDLSGELKASRENCNFLKDIFLTYIKPNLKK